MIPTIMFDSLGTTQRKEVYLRLAETAFGQYKAERDTWLDLLTDEQIDYVDDLFTRRERLKDDPEAAARFRLSPEFAQAVQFRGRVFEHALKHGIVKIPSNMLFEDVPESFASIHNAGGVVSAYSLGSIGTIIASYRGMRGADDQPIPNVSDAVEHERAFTAADYQKDDPESYVHISERLRTRGLELRAWVTDDFAEAQAGLRAYWVAEERGIPYFMKHVVLVDGKRSPNNDDRPEPATCFIPLGNSSILTAVGMSPSHRGLNALNADCLVAAPIQDLRLMAYENFCVTRN